MPKPHVEGRVTPQIEPAHSQEICFTCKTEPRANLSTYCRACEKKHRARRATEKANGTYVPKKRERTSRIKDRAAYNKEYRALNLESVRAWYCEYNKRIRREGIAAYGGKCTCCGEEKEEFLTLEHKEAVPRLSNGKRVPSGFAWMIARKRGWPDDHTILCFNCNCAKGAHGSCPHTWGKYGAK